MPKFTPGPWYFTHHGYEDITGEWDGTIWAEGDENYIGQCYGEANARLIAAAPAMYEALVEMRKCLARNRTVGSKYTWSRDIEEIALDALALADGGDDAS